MVKRQSNGHLAEKLMKIGWFKQKTTIHFPSYSGSQTPLCRKKRHRPTPLRFGQGESSGYICGACLSLLPSNSPSWRLFDGPDGQTSHPWAQEIIQHAKKYPDRSVASRYGSQNEKSVVRALRKAAPRGTVVFQNLKLHDGRIMREIDVALLIPTMGVALIEIKGGAATKVRNTILHGRRETKPLIPKDILKTYWSIIQHLRAQIDAKGSRTSLSIVPFLLFNESKVRTYADRLIRDRENLPFEKWVDDHLLDASDLETRFSRMFSALQDDRSLKSYSELDKFTLRVLEEVLSSATSKKVPSAKSKRPSNQPQVPRPRAQPKAGSDTSTSTSGPNRRESSNPGD